jgi:hypothetical protein
VITVKRMDVRQRECTVEVVCVAGGDASVDVEFMIDAPPPSYLMVRNLPQGLKPPFILPVQCTG